MAQRGKPSEAHEYDGRDQCKHCGMYRVNIDKMSHVCKPWREDLVDTQAAKEQNLSLEDYRLGRDLEAHRQAVNKLGE